jgi:DNA-binding NarL/FixJ family response regulator
MTDRRITVVIVEDHPGVRAGIRKLLEDAGDMEVIGEAENGAQAVRLAGSVAPDIVLMDVELPVLSGDIAARRIRERRPAVKVIAVSSHEDPAYIRGMLESGASGYIIKEEAPEMLLEAMRAVHAHGATGWISPAAYKHSGASLEAPILTNVEVRVLEQLLADRSEAQIGLALEMDAARVRLYVGLLMRKFERETIVGLRDMARQILGPRPAAQDGSPVGPGNPA